MYKIGTLVSAKFDDESEFEQHKSEFDAARQNKLKAIEGAITVEKHISEIVSFFFFGERHERKEAFESIILDSDWCSFSAKRKLLKYVLDQYPTVTNKEKADIDEHTSKTMKYRNAFAHGSFRCEKGAIWLHYFEGKPQQMELSPSNLKKVEKSIITAWTSLILAGLKIGCSVFAMDDVDLHR